jgi:hypothetical protein
VLYARNEARPAARRAPDQLSTSVRKEVIVEILALVSVVLGAVGLGFTIGNSNRR